MFKFGIAAVLVTALADTGYVLARSSTDSTPVSTTVSTTGPSADTRTATSSGAPRAVTASGASAPTSPKPMTAATGSDDPLACPSITRHLTMLMAGTQPDLAEALDKGQVEAVERHMKPMADNYLEDCTKLGWSLAVRTCIANANDFIELQSKCEPPPTQDRGGRLIEDEVHPAYTGSDESCASVGRHMVTLGRPSEATLAKLAPDTREAMERMLSTVPETVETNCESAPWSLAVRRCMLASTTKNQALACPTK